MDEWHDSVCAGHELTPNPLWNKNDRARKLKTPTLVLDKKRERNCQSDVMFLVAFSSGETAWLDAGWFVSPEYKDVE